MSDRGDIIDQANDRAEGERESCETEIRRKAQAMAVGYPGVCFLCGDESPRLVGGACARCRDNYGLD